MLRRPCTLVGCLLYKRAAVVTCLSLYLGSGRDNFNSVPNLIVILFNRMYPIFYVGFICKDGLCERECVKTQGKVKSKKFSWVAGEKLSREVIHVTST